MAWSNDQPRSRTWVNQVKARAGGRCQIRGPGCTGRADVADHIIPIAEGGSLRSLTNGQGACTHCHDIKTAAESARGRARHRAKLKLPTEGHPGTTHPGEYPCSEPIGHRGRTPHPPVPPPEPV